MPGPVPLAEREIREPGIPRYELSQWRQRFGLIAGVTARGEGLDFRLNQTVDPRSLPWMRLAEELGARFRWLVSGRQEHTSKIAVHRKLETTWTLLPETDGHVTQLRGALLLATVADCVPVYLAHPPSSTIALLHAGWRGIAAGILEAGLEQCLKLSGSPPGEWLMHCGISICGECYEVGPEVFRALRLEPAASRKLDLRALLAQRAHKLGVKTVTVSTWCTAHGGDRFYSHRAQGAGAGRMVAYFGFPEPQPGL
ncbi:Laccase domain protein YfiH [bacterium HR33]|nr:Laccase domain protein YfiH [bacterium HR33]